MSRISFQGHRRLILWWDLESTSFVRVKVLRITSLKGLSDSRLYSRSQHYNAKQSTRAHSATYNDSPMFSVQYTTSNAHIHCSATHCSKSHDDIAACMGPHESVEQAPIYAITKRSERRSAHSTGQALSRLSIFSLNLLWTWRVQVLEPTLTTKCDLMSATSVGGANTRHHEICCVCVMKCGRHKPRTRQMTEVDITGVGTKRNPRQSGGIEDLNAETTKTSLSPNVVLSPLISVNKSLDMHRPLQAPGSQPPTLIGNRRNGGVLLSCKYEPFWCPKVWTIISVCGVPFCILGSSVITFLNGPPSTRDGSLKNDELSRT